MPVQESGQLKFLKEGENLIDGFEVIFVNGHTEAMMLPVLNFNGRQVIYCADLIPSAGHLPIPYVMAYDTKPLVTLEEKSSFMANAIKNNSILFFEHDLFNECGSLQQTERGIKIDKVFALSELS